MKYIENLVNHPKLCWETIVGRAAVFKPVIVVALLAATGCQQTPLATTANQSKKSVVDEATESGRSLTRLFWQDRDKGVVCWGDLVRETGSYKLQQHVVGYFPQISVESNEMVQMAHLNRTIVVGIRDGSDGENKSGWIEIATGVDEENHGDHSHWHYSSKAKVKSSKLDAKQGNPAHVYRYGKFIYIANDKKNGFTQVYPSENAIEPATAKFFRGGGGHITLASVGDRVAYSTWIDRKGENAGRIDVVDLRGDHETPRYSFNLPVGGIHGAAPCGNRVFFAPAHGVCWVDCDFDFVLNQDTVDIHHLSLDENPGETDYRTGAFESFHNHLFCVANSKSGTPALCIIDGTTPSPNVVRIPCDNLAEGLRVSTVKATTTVDGRHWVFAFAEGTGLCEKLLIFELDPDRDRDFGDAVLCRTIDVGRSQLDGHFGHHGIAFLGDKKTAVISNPGDGTLAVLDLMNHKVVETIRIGGQPTHLICCGGPE